MLEKECVLRCRREDEQLIEKLLPECLDELQKVWGNTTKITINKEHYLPEDNAGGIELTTKGGKIQVVSTLESRLDLIAGQVSNFSRLRRRKISNIFTLNLTNSNIFRSFHKSEPLSLDLTRTESSSINLHKHKCQFFSFL